MALVIVGLPFWQAGSQWKDRLSSIQRLNLALLVHAQYDSLCWGVGIDPNNIAHLVSEVGIVAELERLDPMRLQLVLLPNAVDCGRADLLLVGHSAHAPWSCVLRLSLHRRVDDRCFLVGQDLFGPPAARPVLQNTGQPTAFVTSTPQQNR